jgi:hypothetical protein
MNCQITLVRCQNFLPLCPKYVIDPALVFSQLRHLIPIAKSLRASGNLLLSRSQGIRNRLSEDAEAEAQVQSLNRGCLWYSLYLRLEFSQLKTLVMLGITSAIEDKQRWLLKVF